MHPRYWIHCAALNAKGVPCGNNGNCPHHKDANRERHRADDEARMEAVRTTKKAEQLSFEFNRLTRERINELIELGRQQAIAEDKGIGSFPCGCLG